MSDHQSDTSQAVLQAAHARHKIGKPFFFVSGAAERSRRNLVIFACLAIVIAFFGLEIRQVTQIGVQIQGLSSERIILLCCIAATYELFMYGTRALDDYNNYRDGLAKLPELPGFNGVGKGPDYGVICTVIALLGKGPQNSTPDHLSKILDKYFTSRRFASKWHCFRFWVMEITIPLCLLVLAWLEGLGLVHLQFFLEV